MAMWLCLGGTRLATADGSVAIERLAAGAMLVTRDGGTVAVGTVGRLRLSADEIRSRPALWPVHVAADALADGLPGTDVMVLPDQLLMVPGGVAVAAKWLVDGVALRRPVPDTALDIYSLDLPAAPIAEAGSALGVAEDGADAGRPPDAVLLPLRQHLAKRAGIAWGALVGSMDMASARQLGGWADDGVGRPLAVELVVDGVIAPPVLADLARPDLAAAGIGDGRRGFLVPPEPALDPRRRHLLRLRRALDGHDLPGSPVLLDGAIGVGVLIDGLEAGTQQNDAIAAACRVVARRLVAIGG